MTDVRRGMTDLLAPRGAPARRALAVGVVAVAALVPCIGLLTGHYTIDLDVYRSGGRAVLEARPLYDVRIGRYGFTYPPFAAMLSTGPAVLPLGVATLLLTAASLFSLAVLLWHAAGGLARWSAPAPSLAVIGGLAALACCAPVRSTLYDGQVNLLLAALVVADLRGTWRWRGAGVGVAAAIKLTPAIFVLYLLVRRRWREAGRAIAVFAVLTAWAAVVLPQDSRRYWTHELFAGSGIGDLAQVSNQSLHGVTLRYLGAGPAQVVWVLLAVPTVLVGLRIAAAVATDRRETFALGIVGVTGCLISPVSWQHHWVWCIPWLAGLAEAARRRGPVHLAGAVGVAAVFVLLNPGPDPFRTGWVVTDFLVANAYVLATLLTAAAVGCTHWYRVLNRN